MEFSYERNKILMIKKLFVFFITIFLVACSTEELPTSEDFDVQIRAVNETAKANQDIEIITELINISNKKFKIGHSDPLITIQAFDEHGQAMFEYIVIDNVGLSHQFKPGETYNPKKEWYSDTKRTIRIETAGTYQLIGTARFSIDQEQYKLHSKPYEIIVEN